MIENDPALCACENARNNGVTIMCFICSGPVGLIPRKTPDEWLKDPFYQEYTIMDPDGWRGADAPSWNTPITEGEFINRLAQCTLMRGLNGYTPT